MPHLATKKLTFALTSCILLITRGSFLKDSFGEINLPSSQPTLSYRAGALEIERKESKDDTYIYIYHIPVKQNQFFPRGAQPYDCREQD